jgi:hypothetical protein
MGNKDSLFTNLPARLLQGKGVKRSRITKKMSYQPEGGMKRLKVTTEEVKSDH